jgi:HAD superfamily hydrolase (TIGR01509 family)
MPAASLLAFDLMDTVVRDPFFHVLPLRLQRSVEELFALLDSRAWVAFETGAMDEAAYLARMFLAPPPPGVTAVDLRDLIVGGYAYVAGMEALLSELGRRDLRLWVLSNYSPWFETIRRELDLDRFFEGHVISYRTGHRKPDPRAYRALLRQAGVSADEVLFIDDREANLEAARALGIDALRFTAAPRPGRPAMTPRRVAATAPAGKRRRGPRNRRGAAP